MTEFTLKLKPLARKDSSLIPLTVGDAAEISMTSKDTGYIVDLQVGAASPVGDATKYVFSLVLTGPGSDGPTVFEKSWAITPQVQPYTLRHMVTSFAVAGSYTAAATVSVAPAGSVSNAPATSKLAAPVAVLPASSTAAVSGPAAQAVTQAPAASAATPAANAAVEAALETIAQTAQAAAAALEK
jgi:hypothetical protein